MPLLTRPILIGRAALIGETAAPSVEAGDPLSVREGMGQDASPELPGTSHFSILDTRGNIVSMTTTVESAFGSHVMAGGMILNNQLTDFSFLPEQDGVAVANAVGPGKRPRSSMAPVIVLNADGSPEMAIGSPGGPAIIGFVTKTMIATLAWDMPLQEAIDLSNLVTVRGFIFVEDDTSAAITEGLEAYGHEVRERGLTSGLYGFRLTDEGIEGGADSRREGNFVSSEEEY